MSLSMSVPERETFLAGVHVGVLSVDDPGRGPLTVPVWYAYRPGGTVDIITSGESLKARRLRVAGRFTLCAQTETVPYRYVSVEGPIAAFETSVSPDERAALAHRYLGPEIGDLYLAATEAEAATDVAFRMAPERWRTTDFAKQFGGGADGGG
jgi:nitroimidazol reductase NimA-like FMN-containing flavoprotein (pyridoxamine 5'-phosphate oxidase superfamily)